jgi:RNA polymerase sigma factor (sigma-70 family)
MSIDQEEIQTIETSDYDLLTQFIQDQDEVAFQELVKRHGALVMGVANRILRNNQDAEDVFQATFLQLASSAKKINKRQSISSWLYKVTYRSAIRLKSKLSRRKEAMLPEDLKIEDGTLEEVHRRAADQTLLEELMSLPEQYREPIILCHLEGESRAAAAEKLGITETVLKGRLQRGRQKLLVQMGIRGAVLSLAFISLQKSIQAAGVVVTENLVNHTASNALYYCTGKLALDLLPESIAFTKEGFSIMQLTLIQKGIVGFIAVGLVLGAAFGMGQGTSHLLAQEGASINSLTEQVPPETEIQTALLTTEKAKNENAEEKPDGIQQKLNKAISVEFIDVPIEDVIKFIEDQAGVEIVLPPDANESFEPVTMNSTELSLSEALDIILEPNDMDYVIEEDVIVVKDTYSAQTAKIYPLHEYLRKDHNIKDFMALRNMILSGVEPDRWEEVGGTGSANSFQDRKLVVFQNQRTHKKIQDFLDILPKNDKFPKKTEEAIEFEKKLNIKLTVSFSKAPLRNVIEFLHQRTKLSINLTDTQSSGYGEEEVTLDLKDASLRLILNRILEPLEADYYIKNGSIIIDHTYSILQPHIYDVSHLIRPGKVSELSTQVEEGLGAGDPFAEVPEVGGPVSDIESLLSCIQRGIEAESWQGVGGPASIQIYQDDKLMVFQTRRNHEKIKDLLDVFAKAN